VGIKVGGKVGISFVLEGIAECSLKMTVEYSLPMEKNEGES
jgi:hypothetical protein